jgi:hypothetical protein
MLMCENPLITSAQITHALLVSRFDVAVQIGPAKTGKVARRFGAVVSQKKHSVTDNILVRILDTDVAVGSSDVFFRILLETLLGVVGEYDIGSWGTAVGTVLCLIKSPHAQTANMTCRMVARCDRVVSNWIGANETHIAIILVPGSFGSFAGS